MQSFKLDRKVENRKALVLLALFAIVAFAWTRGTFDNFLWRVHLNSHDCIQNGFGAVFCGDAADRYKQRLRDAGINP
jgi:hypothetical protein